MNTRAALVLAALGLVGGVGGCASQPEWTTAPVSDAGPLAERASSFARLRREWAIQNLANVDTPGYRATQIIGPDLNGEVLVTGFDQRQGSPVSSDFAFDLMLNGHGFFRLESEEGFVYTRNGRFTLDPEGEVALAIASDMKLSPPISIPSDATDIAVDERGIVSCLISGQPQDERMEIGQITIVTFISPERLEGNGVLFHETCNSGPAVDRDLGVDTTVLHRFYEGSNVDPVRERINIEKAQRVMGF